MRADGRSSRVAHLVFAPPIVDGEAVEAFDNSVNDSAHKLVVDFTGARKVDDDAILLLEWLGQRLESAGGSLAVTARPASGLGRATKTLRRGDPASVLGVHPTLDMAILRRLMSRAGGAAAW